MKTSISKRTRRAITIALASMLLVAPAAQARVDEGGANAGLESRQAIGLSDAGGFSWADAGIGAGAALFAAGGAGYVMRRRALPAHS